MIPVIAVIPSFDPSSATYTIPSSYTKALIKNGAFPVIIPYEASFNIIVSKLSGILFIGGGDPEPKLWNELPGKHIGVIVPQRDAFELNAVREAFDRNIPTLGICRGCQIMNVALGGTLFQDITADTHSTANHMQSEPKNHPSHPVLLNSGSLLYTLLKKSYNCVNSFHHQAINKVAPPLAVSAHSPDGIIEAVECPAKSFFLGIQWHPELMNDDGQNNIISAFVKAAEKYTKEEHK